MASPFFSIEVPGSTDDIKTTDVDTYEVYHLFMQIYPAYSVKKIEDELSWREVKKLMAVSNKEIPTNVQITRIALMMGKYLGATFEQSIGGDKELINTIKGMGWL